MNAIVLIVIALVVAMVVGPVAMLRPSPAQKRRERLRMKARELGLFVHFRKAPKLLGEPDRFTQIAAYGLLCKSNMSWQLVRTAYAHELHINEWWQFCGVEAPQNSIEVLQRALPLLPEGVIGVSCQPNELAIYWREKGDEKDLIKIYDCLKVLSDAYSSPTSTVSSEI